MHDQSTPRRVGVDKTERKNDDNDDAGPSIPFRMYASKENTEKRPFKNQPIGEFTATFLLSPLSLCRLLFLESVTHSHVLFLISQRAHTNVLCALCTEKIKPVTSRQPGIPADLPRSYKPFIPPNFSFFLSSLLFNLIHPHSTPLHSSHTHPHLSKKPFSTHLP